MGVYYGTGRICSLKLQFESILESVFCPSGDIILSLACGYCSTSLFDLLSFAFIHFSFSTLGTLACSVFFSAAARVLDSDFRFFLEYPLPLPHLRLTFPRSNSRTRRIAFQMEMC